MKQLKILGAVLLVLLLGVGVFLFLVHPLMGEMTIEKELVYYVRVFIVLMGMLVFACLRMYNATVANTRFLIKLRDALMGSIREEQNLQRKLSGLKEVFQRTIDTLKEVTRALKTMSTEETKKVDK